MNADLLYMYVVSNPYKQLIDNCYLFTIILENILVLIVDLL